METTVFRPSEFVIASSFQCKTSVLSLRSQRSLWRSRQEINTRFFFKDNYLFFFLLFLSWGIEQNNVPLGLASGNIEGLGEIKLIASLGDSHGVLKGCLLSYFCYCYSSSHGTRMEASSRWYHSTFL